jgi:hypothetical protein
MEDVTMDEAKEKILDQLAKIMTLAKDQAGTPEGESALRMSTKLMAKWNIAESEIDLEKGKGTASGTIFEDEDGWDGLCDEGGKRQWVSSLACAIADTFGCRLYLSTARGTIHFLGTAGDLETCLYFMDIVYSHIEIQARRHIQKASDWRKRNVFGQEAFWEVNARLRTMKHEMDNAYKEFSGGTELMVVKNDLVQKSVDQLFKERGMGKAQNNWVKSRDSSIMAAGREAGRTAPLNRAIQN